MKKTFDYIVVGSGPGGAPVASRLSEDPNTSVLILEAGGENNQLLTRAEGGFFSAFGTDSDWDYPVVPQKFLNNREMRYIRGRVLGGSSAINVGFWLRGCKQDYDKWEELGAKGWNSEAAARIFSTKIENTERVAEKLRGKDGKMWIRDYGSPTSFSHILTQSFVEAGFGKIGDPNGDSIYNVERVQGIFKNHSRLTVADNYLSDTVQKRGNLEIRLNARATKILIENKKVIGLEYADEYGRINQVFVRKEIILAAGSIETPKLLKLSGIGPKEELNALEIDVVIDSPAVGGNLQDHLMVEFGGVSHKNIDHSYPIEISEKSIKQWEDYRNGPLSFFPGAVGGFITTKSKEEAPEFELMFSYNPPVELAKKSNKKNVSGFSINVAMLHAKSRGSVKLSSSNYQDSPIIDFNYLSHPDDMPTFIKGVRKAMLLLETNSLKKITEKTNLSVTSTDEEIADFIRVNCGTVAHPVGTVKMGAVDDSTAVVTPDLKVKGIQGLRVSDASIMPEVNSGHTMAPTIFISEHLAEIIQKENN